MGVNCLFFYSHSLTLRYIRTNVLTHSRMLIQELYELYLKAGCVVTTDSRNCPSGSMFFALKGERFDGNRYAHSAIGQGCSFAVVHDKIVVADSRYILVDNVLSTLRELARYHRNVLGVPVLGITGTNGKTTTKELVAAVLSRKYNVLYTHGNLNNSIGVPLTVLGLRKEHNFAVVEMGASHPGDIEELVNVCCPDFGLITNVGHAHLQGFGSFEGVKKTKGELYDFLKKKDAHKVFVLSDSSDLMEMSSGMDRILYGRSNGAVCGKVSAGNSVFLEFEWNSEKFSIGNRFVKTNLVGSYNLDNVLAAITVGLYFDVPVEDIEKAVREYVPSNNRSQFCKTENNTLIVDAYNANPTSMYAALSNFSTIKSDNKMVILGAMRELGVYSEDEHIQVIRQLSCMNLDKVWLIGPEFLAVRSCAPAGFVFYESTDVMAETLRSQHLKGYTILLKGSNSNNLSGVVDLL